MYKGRAAGENTMADTEKIKMELLTIRSYYIAEGTIFNILG